MGYLLQSRESGAVVVNNVGSIVGMVSAFDFLRKKAFEGALHPMEGSANVEMYVDAAKKICGQSVEDIMTHNPVVVHRKAGMREAAAKMTEYRVQRLPVVDDKGALVGVLTSSYVMRDLHRELQNLPPAQLADEEETSQSP